MWPVWFENLIKVSDMARFGSFINRFAGEFRHYMEFQKLAGTGFVYSAGVSQDDLSICLTVGLELEEL